MIRWLHVPLAALTAVAVSMPVLAADGPSLRPLDRKLNGMRNQIRNASARFENEVRGPIGEVGKDPGYQKTPARICCTPNLDRLNAQVAAVSVLLDELDAAYAEAPNLAGVRAVDELRARLEPVASGVDAFATAPRRSDAEGALGNLHRTYIQMYEAYDGLKDCCALPGDLDRPDADDEASKSKKKKTDKRPKPKKG